GVPYILDWNHATQGNASADVARTYLWLCLYKPDIADLYMDKFCKKSGTSKHYVQQWLPIVSAARLSKHFENEAELLKKWIDIVDYE
ncbi:MAG: aminoglycoside phosphotransferase, partial [Eubacterium sp.]